MLIENLPRELLRIILSLLPSTTNDPFQADYSDLANALLVCKAWKTEGESPGLWKDAKLMIGSMARMRAYCEQELPKRYAMTNTMHISSSIYGMRVMSMDLLPTTWRDMMQMLSSEESPIDNLAFYPINLVDRLFLEKANYALRTGEYDVFPIITSKLSWLKPMMWSSDSMTHSILLKEIVYKLQTDKLKLEVLDLRTMEIPNSYGTRGRTGMKMKLQETSVKILYQD